MGKGSSVGKGYSRVCGDKVHRREWGVGVCVDEFLDLINSRCCGCNGGTCWSCGIRDFFV